MNLENLPDFGTLKDFASNGIRTQSGRALLISLSGASLTLPLFTEMPVGFAIFMSLFWISPVIFSFPGLRKNATRALEALNAGESMPARITLVKERTIDDSPELTVDVESKCRWHLRLNTGEHGADKLIANRSYTGDAYLHQSDGQPRLIHVNDRLVWNIFSMNKISQERFD